jgi:hypothetical protein
VKKWIAEDDPEYAAAVAELAARRHFNGSRKPLSPAAKKIVLTKGDLTKCGRAERAERAKRKNTTLAAVSKRTKREDSTTASASKPAKFEVGHEVLAVWPGDGKMYRAIVTSVEASSVTVKFRETKRSSAIHTVPLFKDGYPHVKPLESQ